MRNKIFLHFKFFSLILCFKCSIIRFTCIICIRTIAQIQGPIMNNAYNENEDNISIIIVMQIVNLQSQTS